MSGRWREIVAFLDRPLVETRVPEHQTIIAGRVSERRLLVTVVPPLLLGWVLNTLGLLPSPWEAFTGWIDRNLCEEGWGGWSVGGLGAFLSLTPAVALVLGLGIGLFIQSYRMFRRERSVPVGYRPWFDTTLYEGKSARRRGATGMVMAAALMLIAAAVSVNALVALWPVLVKSPAQIAHCGSK